MSKLRVAIVFSGQPRCVDGVSYQGFRKCVLDNYDVDVYAHFWSDIESNKSVGTAADNIGIFKTLYNPKAIQVDPPLTAEEYPLSFIQPHSPIPLTPANILDITSSNWSYWVRNCVSMYTSMGRAYELCKKSGIRYDWIIRTRTDCALLRCPRLDSLDKQYMYAPDWHGNTNPVVVNHALITPPDIAEKLFQIRESLETLPGHMDEAFVYNHLKNCGLIDRVRMLPMTMFNPGITRDGNIHAVLTSHPSSTIEVVDPRQPKRVVPFYMRR
jgi:hypothetical protein